MPTTPPRIEVVTARQFRGATSMTSIPLDPSKPFVLVFGENGTGKSTIVDAIEFVFNLTPGSIADISGADDKQHLHSIGRKLSDLSASVTIGPKSWTATYSAKKFQRTPADPLPQVRVLRRSSVLSLVNAQPAKRFERLKRFIDVANVERCEDELSKALSDVRKDIDRKAVECSNARSNLEKAFSEEHTLDEKSLTVEAWAKLRSQADISLLEARKSALKGVIDANSQVQLAIEGRRNAQAALDQAQAHLQEIERSIAEHPTIEPDSAVTLIDLLDKARTYVSQSDEIDACPVCAKPNDSTTLQATIDAKLGELSPLVELARKLASARGKVTAAASVVENCRKGITSRVAVLTKLLHELPDIAGAPEAFNQAAFPSLFAWNEELTNAALAETDRVLDLSAPFLSSAESEHDLIEKKISPARAIKRDYQALVDSHAEALRLEKVKGVLERMLDVVRNQRILFVQAILDAIADDCDKLYARIHPGEDIGNVRFAFDQEKRASLGLTSYFEGHTDVPPQAYFSESHLDTLGFCFFLALTHYLTRGRAIVVLDDVFTSVDLQHIDRALNLLLDEADRYFQIVLFTHQRRWLMRFESNHAPRQKADIITLRPWSLEHGVHAERPLTTMEALAEHLEVGASSRRELGATAAFLIETVLEEMTRHLECTVKRNTRDKYTCATLLDAMTKPSRRIQVLLDGAEMEGPPLQTIVDELKRLSSDARNTVGDHFSWDAAEVTDRQVQDFAGNAMSLAQRFVCPKCGGMTTRLKSAHLYCPCNTLQVSKPE